MFLLKCLGKLDLKEKISVRQRINYRLQYETILFLLECLEVLKFKIKDNRSTELIIICNKKQCRFYQNVWQR
jgi:hypothetical protein